MIIGVDIGLCLRLRHAKIRGKGIGADAVYDAEIHGLGSLAQFIGDIFRRCAKDGSRGGGVDVGTGEEPGDHGFILRHVCQQAQFDLGIVGVHQHIVFILWDEVPAHLAPQFGADGDVLQVRLSGGEAPGGGQRLFEVGVDAPVFVYHLQKPHGIGGIEFGDLAVVEYLPHDGVDATQMAQHLAVGRIAGLGLARGGQPQFFKQDVPQLARGIEIEHFARQVIDLVGQGVHGGLQLVTEGCHAGAIQFETGLLDLGQEHAERQFHLLQQGGLPVLTDAGKERLFQRREQVRIGGILLQGAPQIRHDQGRGRHGTGRGVQYVGIEHHIVRHPAQRLPAAVQMMVQRFGIVAEQAMPPVKERGKGADVPLEQEKRFLYIYI